MLSILAVSFGFASSHLSITSAPLQPVVVSVSDPSRSTTSLASSVRTTTRTAVTTTKSS
jgi:hypothetical protein